LSTANTYTGTTTINAGILSISQGTDMSGNSALGTTAGGTIVNSGGSLELLGGITVTGEALSLDGTGSASNGALRSLSGSNSYAGVVTLAGHATIQTDAGSLTLSTVTATDKNLTVA